MIVPYVGMITFGGAPMAKGKNNQKDHVKDFISAENELFKHFKCDESFFVKAMPASKWVIKNEGDFHFLYYWPTEDKRMEAVIVKKDGEPMIYKTDKYTMIIGIDCVKIGFIFHNGNKRSSM